MRRLCHVLLSAALLASIAPAMAAEPPAINPLRGTGQPLTRFVQYDTDPCTDGRYSDGKPRSCREIMRMLERRDRYRQRRERYDPCTDGRVSDGRPRSCREIRRWLRERDDEDGWRPAKQWK
ncbi:hypothetical protein EV217_0870 [Phyllobacterium myrsinacearum]|uniref:hypothetical protein n=1 Tax=Phyllobacterium myrsinacearum TaxID=28101 RepID=UPI00102A281A|nr:hypothetical protein [Phyllobacterium myrsinacearum]RZS88484.1 hypothetical protein EV217_0870 [Phyllobacterium myrsinacearum]